jgi:hypothetical protein
MEAMNQLKTLENDTVEFDEFDIKYKIKILYHMRIYYAYLKTFGMNYRQLLLDLNKTNSTFPNVLKLFFEKIYDDYKIKYLADDEIYPDNATDEDIYSLHERIKKLYESILY